LMTVVLGRNCERCGSDNQENNQQTFNHGKPLWTRDSWRRASIGAVRRRVKPGFPGTLG
jgi:hypothetical protein